MRHLNAAQPHVIAIGKAVHVKPVAQPYIHCRPQFCFGPCEIVGACDLDIVFAAVNDFDGNASGARDLDVIRGAPC